MLCATCTDASRGDLELELESTEGLTPGSWVRLTMSDPPRGTAAAGTLIRKLYGGAPHAPTQCFAKCPFTGQFDRLSDQLCQSLDQLSSHRTPPELACAMRILRPRL